MGSSLTRVKFSELTDEQWELIEPHLPPPARTGRPRNDDRPTINGILYVLVTGCRWMDMPAEYGSHKSVWERHKIWSESGVWKRVSHGRAGGEGILGWCDRRGLPLGRQLYGACQKGGGLIGFDGHKKIEGTKIHVAVTEGSLPVAVMISRANIHEGTRLIPLLESISIETGHRPRKRPKTVYADTKYATPLNRFYLDRKHVRSQIPDPPNKKRKRPGRETQALRQGGVPRREVQRGEILRVAEGVQADHDQVREAAVDIPRIRSARVRGHTPKVGFQMSS